MRNLIVLLRKKPPSEAIMSLVSEWGGIVGDDRNAGDVHRDDAFIIVDARCYLHEYETHEIEPFAAFLGELPRAAISIHYDLNEASDELARSFAQELIGRWGGTIDFDP